MPSVDDPSWYGVPEPVPLHPPTPIRTYFIVAFLTIPTVGLILLVVAWDLWSRAHAIGREGIHCHRGILCWGDLVESSVHPTTKSFYRMQFVTRTINVAPWLAPHPDLVMAALSAGTGEHVYVEAPRA